MFRLLSSALSLLAAYATAAQDLPDHGVFDRALRRVVHGRSVDYAALKAGPTDLEHYLEELASTPAARLEAADATARMAFWINAYNACALKLVIDHYPIRKPGFPASLVRSLQGVPANSIRQIPDTWDRKFCPVAGQERSLDEIEHEIIRPMGDPRIHFAVNCASRSCPALARSAYRPGELSDQLDEAVRRFLADSTQYRLVRGDAPVIRLNKILDWYQDDFGGTDGVVTFLLRYVGEEDAAYIRANAPPIEYNDYDWTLNDTAVFGGGG